MTNLTDTSKSGTLQAISRPSTLKESALAELRNSIMLGRLAPGERLVERVLGEQLQVSRTVVRECIRHLESEKLVTVIANSGPAVARLSEAEIREIYQLRAVLESGAVRQCAQRIDQPAAATLHKHVEHIARHLSEQQVISALEATTDLYRDIFRIGELSVSWGLIEQLNGRINQLRIRSLSTQARRSKGPKNLKKLVALIANGDADQAEAFSRQHVLEAMDAAMAQSSKDQQNSDN